MIIADNELQEKATTWKFRIVQNEGDRIIERDVIHYNTQMIIAVRFKVNSERSVQFKKLINQIVSVYTIKGWVMNYEL